MGNKRPTGAAKQVVKGVEKQVKEAIKQTEKQIAKKVRKSATSEVRTTALPTFAMHDVFLNDGDEFIHAMPIGRDAIVARYADFDGVRRLDVRRYYLDEESDQWKPTGKGVAIPLGDELTALLTALVDRHFNE